MQLKLVFGGNEPIPQNLMVDVLRFIDRRLFVHEKKAFMGLGIKFPQLSKEQLQEWRGELDRQYRAGEFSMLYVESVRQGSIEYYLIHGAHVVEFTVGAILGVCAKEALKGTPVYNEITRHIRYYFMKAQETRLIKSVLEMSKRYNQTPPIVQEAPENRAGSQFHPPNVDYLSYAVETIPRALSVAYIDETRPAKPAPLALPSPAKGLSSPCFLFS
jgi:hypothetical protein